MSRSGVGSLRAGYADCHVIDPRLSRSVRTAADCSVAHRPPSLDSPRAIPTPRSRCGLLTRPRSGNAPRHGLTPRPSLPRRRCLARSDRRRAASRASTITRSTGSVPDGRSSTRPEPLRMPTASCSARRMASLARQSKPRRIGTLISRCGNSGASAVAAASVVFCSRSARSTASAATMASPVVCLSRQMMWPEFSPPSSQPFSLHRSRARSGRRRPRARAECRVAPAPARSRGCSSACRRRRRPSRRAASNRAR